jgi:RNA polymerase sigma factor (sigma-70 family)
MDEASRVQLQHALETLSVDRTDNDAWRTLSEHTRPTVFDAAKRVLRGQADLADDVVQEAFLRIFQYCNFADLRDVDAFLRYLKAVCRNVACDMLKDSSAESIVENTGDGKLEARVLEETPENLVIAQETRNEFMNQLNETDREVLSLSMDGYDLAEIADRLGLSYSNAGVRLHRSRERLRNYLRKKDKSEPVCKKSVHNEVICSQETRVTRETDSLVPIRAA